jgi:ankyrin repeat protein
MTSLMIASLAGNTNIIKILLDAGVSVTSKDSRGRTALYYAKGYPHIIDLLNKSVSS